MGKNSLEEKEDKLVISEDILQKPLKFIGENEGHMGDKSLDENIKINLKNMTVYSLVNLLVNNLDAKLFSAFSFEELRDFLGLDKEILIKIIFNKVNSDIIQKSIISPKIRDKFVFEKERKYQLETINEIYNAIEDGYKYIILEACSGFGKSGIATTLSLIYTEGKSYILNPDNQLLSAYTEHFSEYGIKKVQARRYFQCRYSNYKGSSFSNCKKENCIYYRHLNANEYPNYDQSCRYLYQVKEGLNSPTILCTYVYFFIETFYQDKNLGHRKLLICDEGHNIDDNISEGVSLRLTEKRLKKIIDCEYERMELEFKESYFHFLNKVKLLYKNFLNCNYDDEDRIKYQRDLDNINKFLSYFEKDEANIVFEYQTSGLTYPMWVFKPVNVKKFVKDVLFDYSDVCIFMSSSIFDYENFAYDLGIDEEEIYKIKVPNIFDLSNSPIKLYDDYEMSSENFDIYKEYSLQIINEIFKKHNNEKGIIHTPNHEIKNYLYENLGNRVLTHQSSYDREEVLNKFKSDRSNKVLISPSMEEGVDLPGDQCRFQIIYKLPYLDISDKRVYLRKETFEDGKEWYTYKMLTKLIQAYGRGIRFEGDYCKTYILDKRLFGVIANDLEEKQIIPKYFIDAIEDIEI